MKWIKTHNPGHFVVELYRSNIVKMSVESEKATPVLRPYVCVCGN